MSALGPWLEDRGDDALHLARTIGRARGKLEMALQHDKQPLAGGDWRDEVRNALTLLERAYP